jgi:xylose isomerase
MASPQSEQQSLVSRLMEMSGGAYSPEQRRKYFISGPQWAAAYEGHALFHAPTRDAVGYAEVIRRLGEMGVGYWLTHDTDVIATDDLLTDKQWETVARHQQRPRRQRRECSMVTCGTGVGSRMG